MPTVDCKLTDCNKHGKEICIAKFISVDGCGQVECYEPVQSKLVHAPFNPNCQRDRGKYRNKLQGC